MCIRDRNGAIFRKKFQQAICQFNAIFRKQASAKFFALQTRFKGFFAVKILQNALSFLTHFLNKSASQENLWGQPADAILLFSFLDDLVFALFAEAVKACATQRQAKFAKEWTLAFYGERQTFRRRSRCLLYTSDACRRYAVCRSRWSPYH